MQQRQVRLYPFPQPMGKHFAGGILQPIDVVQAVVVELFDQRLDDALDHAKIDEIALIIGHFTCDDDVKAKRVAVHPPALVPLRETRQPVSGFKFECL